MLKTTAFFSFPDSPIVQCDVVNNDDDHNYRKILFTSLNKSNGQGLQEQFLLPKHLSTQVG